METIQWYHFIAAFFAGVFLANAVPHFVHGISGDKFPTPFAKPHGKGLSSPKINAIWALVNLVIGYFLYQAGHLSTNNKPIVLTFFIGVAVISLWLANTFSKKDKE